MFGVKHSKIGFQAVQNEEEFSKVAQGVNVMQSDLPPGDISEQPMSLCCRVDSVGTSAHVHACLVISTTSICFFVGNVLSALWRPMAW